MVDLETMSTNPTAAIISIAAVEFDIKTGETGRQFYRNVSLKSSMQNGLTIDGDTIEWWLKQSKEAISVLFDNQVGLIQALINFNEFYAGYERVWANPCSFDFPILENAYRSNGSESPFSYKLRRDLKTFMDLTGTSSKDIPFKGVEHNALDDCLHQIKLTVVAYEKI